MTWTRHRPSIWARRLWRQLRAEYDQQQTTLQVQASRLNRIEYESAERHHELQNGLASLAQAHRLLDGSVDTAETALLRQAVISELNRLEAMLASSYLDGQRVEYEVASILLNLVVLRQAAGRDVKLDVDPQLKAAGCPEVLAQVLTNLLTNCERHAPGSPVRITARRRHDRVLIEVADDGPGVPPALRQVATERSVRGSHTGGSGLGLHICTKLLDAQGGRIQLVEPPPHDKGCQVRIELPAAFDCEQSKALDEIS